MSSSERTWADDDDADSLSYLSFGFGLSGIWTADASKQNANLEIGRKLKEQLGIHGKIGFQLHRDTMVKHSSVTKNLYTV